jgi:hypothetical protein
MCAPQKKIEGEGRERERRAGEVLKINSSSLYSDLRGQILFI